MNLANIGIPILLVAGTLDGTSPPEVSKGALEQISSDEKASVLIENATHRSFDSTYCDQAQAAARARISSPSRRRP